MIRWAGGFRASDRFELVPRPHLAAELRKAGAGDIVIVCGGVIPPQDYDFLLEAGASAIYGPGTNIPQAASEILEIIRDRRAAAAA